MATSESGVNKVKYDAGGSGDNYIPSGEYGGQVRSIYDTFECSGITTGSTIALPTIPNASKVIGIYLAWDALGSSSTIALGDALSSGRYAAAAASTSAGTNSAIALTGLNYEIGTTATDNVPLVTITAGTSINGTVSVVIFYV